MCELCDMTEDVADDSEAYVDFNKQQKHLFLKEYKEMHRPRGS